MLINSGWEGAQLWIGIAISYFGVVLLLSSFASRVRPHLLGQERLLLRWGIHEQLSVPVPQMCSVTRGAAPPGTDTPFTVPGTGKGSVTVSLYRPLHVLNDQPSSSITADHITFPVDDEGRVLEVINNRLLPAGSRPTALPESSHDGQADPEDGSR